MSLPAGWVQRESKSHNGRVFYYCQATGESVWERPVAPAPGAAVDMRQQVRVLHILRKHNGSRRPASWREPHITQSREEALRQINDFRQRLVDVLNTQGQEAMLEEFKKIAEAHSDCGSHERGGDLGNFSRGHMQKPFEEASFALAINQLSEPVDTDSGVHILLRVPLEA